MLVAGFQGVSVSRDVTTLGRGGSDTTAVALAAAVGPTCARSTPTWPGCSAPTRGIVPDARKLPVVSFEEMLEMASSGARVLQLRAVEYARNHGVRLHCRSSFEDAPGTVVVSEEETLEQPLITAVTHSTQEARVTLLGVPDRPGIAGRIFGALAEANVNVDMIVQNEPVSEGARADISFTVPRADVPVAQATLEPLRGDMLSRRGHRRRDGHGVDRRGGDEVASRRGGQGVRHAGRAGDQHRDDLHLADQDLVRDRGERRCRARCRLCTPRSSWVPQVRPEEPFEGAR